MKTSFSITRAVLFTAVIAMIAFSAVAEVQKTCPTCGGAVGTENYIDVSGKRIYVCNDGCAKEVKADPAKFIALLEKDGVTIEKAPVPQTLCPVMGGKIDKTSFVDVQGKRIYMCCAGCSAKIKADPAKYIAQLEKEGITIENTPIPQTVCPVMGGKIDKAQFVDVLGKRIYMCCAGCSAKIKADPAKYISEMEKSGITIEKAPQ